MAERDGIDSGGSTTDVDARWAAFAGWFAQRLSELPAASVLDAGRGDATPETDGYDVECAQVQRLYGDRYLLRCSTTLMIIPLLDCYDGDNVALDTWHHDDLFEDCTHGYLVSESPQMVADLVVGWFRERCGFAEPDLIGFAYMRAKSLPHTASRGDWMTRTVSRSSVRDS